MAKKRVLYLRTDITNVPLVAGGSVAHTLGVIDGFLSHGIELVCASSVMHEQLQDYSFVSFISLKNPSWMSFMRWRPNCFISTLVFANTILKALKTTSYDAIYQRYSILNATGVLLKKLKRVPLILEYNGSEAWIDNNWLAKKPIWALRWLSSKVESLTIHEANFIIVVSQPLKNELIARGVAPTKILVNPNGVNSKLFDPEKLIAERNAIRKELNAEHTTILGFIGTFSQWHGIEMFAQIIPPLLAKHPDLHFLLIGDGPLKEWLHQELSEKKIDWQCVTFTGIVPQQKARNYLSACDGFLSPTAPNPDGSPFFGSPTKLFEYLSLAKPIIASNLDQVGDIIHPAFTTERLHKTVTHEVGYKVNPRSPEQFIAAIENLKNRTLEDRKIIGDNARIKAQKEYEWHEHVRKIVTFSLSS